MAKVANRLSARWSKAREHGVSRLNGQVGDVLYEWGDGCSKADGALLHYHFGVGPMQFDEPGKVPPFKFGEAMIEELHARGYDLTTLKFSINKRKFVADPAPQGRT